MEVIKTGKNPNICIIGGIHGDEPCGKYAIDKLIKKEHEKPVKYIIANEEALNKKVRYIDSDLNRSFYDNKRENHEEKLASKITKEIKDCDNVLALHSTKSTSTPFGFSPSRNINEVFKYLPIKNIVIEETKDRHSILSLDDQIIEVECGYQKSEEASKNALNLSKIFLNYYNALTTEFNIVKSKLDLYSMYEKVEKNNNTIFTHQNFKKLKEGEIYAFDNKRVYRASEEFYPILMSTRGYKNILGYKGNKIS